jgi:hypothetical protein
LVGVRAPRGANVRSRSTVVDFLFMPNTACRSLEEIEAENCGNGLAASTGMSGT